MLSICVWISDEFLWMFDQCCREERDWYQEDVQTSSNTWTRKKRDNAVTQQVIHFSSATTAKYCQFCWNNCGLNKVNRRWRSVTEWQHEKPTMVSTWTPVRSHAVWRLKVESRLWAWITSSTGCSGLWSLRSQQHHWQNVGTCWSPLG